MSKSYEVLMTIRVTVSDTEGKLVSALEDSNTYFVNQTFTQMADKSDKYFELIAALQKTK